MDVRAKHGRCMVCQVAWCFAPRHFSRYAFILWFRSKQMRRLFLSFWIVIVVVFAFSEINAQCSCKILPGSRKYEPYEALKTSDVVFTGEIIEIQKGSVLNEEKIKFKIESVWKIDVGETFILRTYKRSCGFSGKVGDKYLIYAYKDKKTFTTNFCTRTKSLGNAAKDLKEFEEKGEKPIKIYE